MKASPVACQRIKFTLTYSNLPC